MVCPTPLPHSSIRRCCNSMSGQRSRTNPGAEITGSCKTEQHLTQLTSTSTFSSKSFVEGSSPVNRHWGTTGHHTFWVSILLTTLSEDLLRTRNQPELIPEQQQAMTDVAATIPIEKLRDAAKMCANAPGAVSRLPVAIVSISFSQCKNADSKLFSSIFGVTIQ